MIRKAFPAFLLIITSILASCSAFDEPDGKWDDNIKLSAKKFNFVADADSVTINTKGDWWWIDGISLNDINFCYYQRDGIDLESDSYTLKDSCFVVEKRDQHTLFIKMDKNPTKESRVLTVSLQAGDYFDSIKVTQSGKPI